MPKRKQTEQRLAHEVLSRGNDLLGKHLNFWFFACGGTFFCSTCQSKCGGSGRRCACIAQNDKSENVSHHQNLVFSRTVVLLFHAHRDCIQDVCDFWPARIHEPNGRCSRCRVPERTHGGKRAFFRLPISGRRQASLAFAYPRECIGRCCVETIAVKSSFSTRGVLQFLHRRFCALFFQAAARVWSNQAHALFKFSASNVWQMQFLLCCFQSHQPHLSAFKRCAKNFRPRHLLQQEVTYSR